MHGIVVKKPAFSFLSRSLHSSTASMELPADNEIVKDLYEWTDLP